MRLLPFARRFGIILLILYSQHSISQKTTKWLKSAGSNFIDNEIINASNQMNILLTEVNALQYKGKVSPRTLDTTGNLVMVPAKDWTSGFFPGILWQLYGLTDNSKWFNAAKTATAKIEKEKLNASTHDIGFKIYCSYGKGYALTKDSVYKNVILQSAKTLSTRFNPIVGALRSWDHNQDKWKYPVIIDNMLNLELLFEATRLSGDSSFYKIAVSHANTTLKNHFRKDGGSYHVIDYDPNTGQVLKRNTHQGYSDASTWARGQAWALYGFTLCYRETKDSKYLDKALNVANWILHNPHLPKDDIPYWDFDAPNIPNEPRDVSAATVIASGLYELSTFSQKDAIWLKSFADKIVNNLAIHYKAPPGKDHGFILVHSTGSKPAKSEIDVPLIYADYYYLEALSRKKNLEKIE